MCCEHSTWNQAGQNGHPFYKFTVNSEGQATCPTSTRPVALDMARLEQPGFVL